MLHYIKDKVVFIGGWFLIILAGITTIYIAWPNSMAELEVLQQTDREFLILAIFVPLGLMFWQGGNFIEQSLRMNDKTPKESSNAESR